MNEYKNLIFTHHASARFQDRHITADAIWQTVQWPDKKFTNHEKIKFIKTINDRRLHVIASWLAKDKKWLIISVWVRGEEDKEPIIWSLITLPFKITYWLLTRLVKLIQKHE
jgi:hypothetical protein